MSTEHKGNSLNEPVFSKTGKLLNRPLPEGDLLKTEGPEGDPLWKKKKKLNEDGSEEKMLNE
jgi:hypothetical protein